MKPQAKLYRIPFVGLKIGVHRFSYSITDHFFLDYPAVDFEEPQVSIELTFDKKTNFFLLQFDIGGSVKTTCDRCAQPMNLPLWEEFKIVVKMVDDPTLLNQQEQDPEVFYLSKTETHLYIAPWLYDFINLSIPISKTCDMVKNQQCDEKILKLISNHQTITVDNSQLRKGLEQLKNKFHQSNP